MELVTVGGELKNRRLVWYVFKTFYCFSGWNWNSFFFFFIITKKFEIFLIFQCSHLFLNIHLNTWNYIHGCAVKEHQIKTFDVTPSKIIECSQLLSNQHSIFRTACMENRMFLCTIIYCTGRAVCIRNTQYTVYSWCCWSKVIVSITLTDLPLLCLWTCIHDLARGNNWNILRLHEILHTVLASGGNQTETLFSPPGGRIQ